MDSLNQLNTKFPRTRATTVLLRSSDGIESGDGTLLSFALKTPLVAKPDERITVQCMTAQIPNSFYNTTSLNNSFTVTETVSGTAVVRTITIPEGNYDVFTFRTTLLTALNASTVQYAVVFNTTTGKFTFSTSTAHVSAVTWNTTGKMRRALGFTENAAHVFSGSPLTLVSDQVVDLSGNNHSILVKAGFDSSSFITSQSMRPEGVISVIPINAGNYDVIQYVNETEFTCLLKDSRIDLINLSLQNQDGVNLVFNGPRWELTLTFRFEKVLEYEQTDINLQRRIVNLTNRYLQIQLKREEERRRTINEEMMMKREKLNIKSDE